MLDEAGATHPQATSEWVKCFRYFFKGGILHYRDASTGLQNKSNGAVPTLEPLDFSRSTGMVTTLNKQSSTGFGQRGHDEHEGNLLTRLPDFSKRQARNFATSFREFLGTPQMLGARAFPYSKYQLVWVLFEQKTWLL